ncbi:hypothetical protein [Paludibacter sp.]|uniref:hypothetical protein n=1 Tax=Paludibacter sp. TaxID=1898105 RepID=UPI0013527689|nr:hypothetical protein [Paludibacter sp.]MTK52662.1 hypothetical protein [Paludibacter sp.]
MKNIFTKKWNYSLYEDENGAIILSVLCGTVGLFEREIVLSENEVNSFNAMGESFLDELAHDVRNDYEKYKSRFVE